MDIILQRIKDTGVSTTGKFTVDGLEYVTIEDTFRAIKVAGVTRIPSGTYEVKLKTTGKHHGDYGRKFPDFHKGMLWLQNVPDFTDILIHLGNRASDSAGCIIIGSQIDSDDFISGSTRAYIQFYKHVSKAILAGEKVWIKIIDNERN